MGPASSGVINAAARTTIEGAEVVRWWKDVPRASQGPGFPLREGDQVMRIVFAPFVDRVGDYYTRSEVYAVMRPGGWWGPGAAPEAFVVKPLPEAASARTASK
nr:TraV family lipoprotein [Caulobacter sp. 17J65-9]